MGKGTPETQEAARVRLCSKPPWCTADMFQPPSWLLLYILFPVHLFPLRPANACK